MLNKSKVLIIVPAFNEETSISAVIQKLKQADYSLLVVNDGSTDRTSEVARSYGVPVLDMPYNLGVGGALRAGFKYAVVTKYEAVVQIDADGQHPVSDIEKLINAANKTDAQMIVGSRFLSTDTTMKVSNNRRFIMKFLARSASKAANTTITDASSGYRLISQPLLGEFARHFSDGYLSDTYGALVSAGRAGYRITEIPVGFASRSHGVSSANTSKAILSIIKVVGTALLHLHLSVKPHTGSKKNSDD